MENNHINIEPTAESGVGAAVTKQKSEGCCSTGGSCSCSSGDGTCGTPASKKCSTCSGRATKLDVYNWLADIPEAEEGSGYVEVQFKNTRKGYYLNSTNLDLYTGDMVAVEASPGHDIGYVTLTGKLVQIQMKKNNFRPQQGEQKRVYRIAKPLDIEKYEHAKTLEQPTMIRSRAIAENLGLQMKIGDVEYQGDGNKAIFYYIADKRVDFRQLIKVLAEEFHVRIEMKQIGARQEAGRIGGIGPCGRELCCSSWMSNFVSVSTSAARYQDISLNPQKLAGQCGKLKCCLNYEIDQYVEAHKQLPSQEIPLETLDGSFFHFKTDVFSGMMTYSSSKSMAANLVTVSKERVFEIIQMNKSGMKPKNLNESEKEQPKQRNEYNDVLETESITRFDDGRNKRKKLTHKPNIFNSNKAVEGNHAPTKNNGDRTKGDNPQNSARSNRKSDKNQGRNQRNSPRFHKGQRKDNRNNNDSKPSQE